MSDLKVIYSTRQERRARGRQSRRGRRPRGRRHLIRRAIAVLVLGVLALFALSLIPSGASPSHPHVAAVIQTPPPAVPAVNKKAPVYGQALDPVQVDPKLKLGLRAGLLFDVRTGRVLWQRDPNRRLAIASLTKMMTALVVVKHSSPGDHVLITREATDFSGSGVGLLPRGKRVPELPLLYGLLLPSGNDAAVALAQHVSGTQGRFIGLMNATAKKMGLTCTHFATVSGLVDKNNYSCPRDLAALAHAVLEQPLLRRIVSSRKAVLPFPIKARKLYLYNNNPLLMAGYPGTDGIKTGFTYASGLCLVAAARQDGQWLGVVLLHSANWTTQGERVLTAGFDALRRAGRQRPAHA